MECVEPLHDDRFVFNCFLQKQSDLFFGEAGEIRAACAPWVAELLDDRLLSLVVFLLSSDFLLDFSAFFYLLAGFLVVLLLEVVNRLNNPGRLIGICIIGR